MRMYDVSQDKNGYWYAHPVGYPAFPCFGTFTQDKRKAVKYAADWSGLTIEQYRAAKNRRRVSDGDQH